MRLVAAGSVGDSSRSGIPPGRIQLAAAGALLPLALLLTGCSGRSTAGVPSDGGIAFRDERRTSGLSFPLGHAAKRKLGIRDTIGHGAAIVDVDGDGLPDVLLTGPDRVTLFRNLGGWQFRPLAQAGFRQKGYWQGVAAGDVDNDGRPDLFLSGFGCSALYLNRGDGRFRDVTEVSGLTNHQPTRWETSAAFADVDLDGRLDLYVAAYVELRRKTGVCTFPGGISTACAPIRYAPQHGTLYRNLGGARFQDVTASYGLSDTHGNGLGVAFGTVTGSDFPDLYVANDQLPCDLYLNQQGRRFVNRGLESGTALSAAGSPQAGMGVDFGDYDNDGRDDLIVANYLHEPRSLYHSDGNCRFSNLTGPSGLGPATVNEVAWGVKWADWDNDGWLDLALANGHPLHRIHELDSTATYLERFQLFRNAGGGRFAEVTPTDPALCRPLAGRALCVGDLDNDGKPDLLISDIEGQPLLLRNVTPTHGYWLTIRLIGKRGIEGAAVTVRAGAHRWSRRSTSGGSYLSASDPRVHFGLGTTARLDEVIVRWPGGKLTRRSNPGLNQEITLSFPGN